MTDQIHDLLIRLANIPTRIEQAVAHQTTAALQAAPAPDEWSAMEILAHLRASDDIIAYRLYAILARDNPPLPAFDDRRWAEVAGYLEADFRQSLTAFRLRRAELIAMLQKATRDDWQRVGAHETRGTLTLFEMAKHLVEHEEEHCLQLEKR